MVPELKLSQVRKVYPRRAHDSHKGMNGRVMVIGGSIDYHGAPVLSGLGALQGGADLVYLFVPECNFDVTRSKYPDFIVRSFPGNYLDMKAVNSILEFSKKCDVVLMGPGIGDHEESFEAMLELTKRFDIPTVLDSQAIQVFQKIKEIPLSQKIVITPHHNEFEHLTGKDIKIAGSLSGKIVLVRTIATDLRINILLKGPQDLVASEDGEIFSNNTGNAGMTVGGSGDVLSGYVAGLIAQGAAPFAACQAAAYLFGKTGDHLFKSKGYCYTATDLASELPYVIRENIF